MFSQTIFSCPLNFLIFFGFRPFVVLIVEPWWSHSLPVDDDKVIRIHITGELHQPAGADAGFPGHYCKLRFSLVHYAILIDVDVVFGAVRAVDFFHYIPRDICGGFEGYFTDRRIAIRPYFLQLRRSVESFCCFCSGAPFFLIVKDVIE